MSKIYRNKMRMKIFKKRVFRMMGPEVPCYLCETPLTVELATVDHYIPLCWQGEDSLKNYEICCNKCNNLKAHKYPIGWMRKRREKNRIPDDVRYGDYTQRVEEKNDEH